MPKPATAKRSGRRQRRERIGSGLEPTTAGIAGGVYESEPKFWALDGIPPEFGQELPAPDIERLEAHLLRVMERIPAFGEAGIKTVNNGPIC